MRTDKAISSEKNAHLLYQKFKGNKANEWLRSIQLEGNEQIPSAEQLRCIKTIVDRCVQEAKDERSNTEYRSEPLRLILHGVPGGPSPHPRVDFNYS